MFKNPFQRRQEAERSLDQLSRLAERMPLLALLGGSGRERLARLARDFLRRKTIEAAGGLNLQPGMRELVALQAALPVLNLGLELYDGWYAVILYPDEFRAPYEVHEDDGVVHQGSRDLAGESWERGPLVLAWSQVERDAWDPQPSGNLVIHELAHKLDMLNGAANGMPPLHREMRPALWSQTLSAAYDDLNARLDGDLEPPIDAYAAESPGEFFAVIAELFFAWPESLAEAYPAVYRQLAAYFRQDLLGG